MTTALQQLHDQIVTSTQLASAIKQHDGAAKERMFHQLYDDLLALQRSAMASGFDHEPDVWYVRQQVQFGLDMVRDRLR